MGEAKLQNSNLKGANWQNSERYGALFENTIMPDGEVVSEPNCCE
jgi:uncharacterized protein YjbI with pentapeptide repeats